MVDFPNESKDYRAKRNELLKAEAKLRADIEKVAALRREMPAGGEVSEDYTFESTDGPVRMSDLFQDGKDTLLIYNYMYGPEMENSCPLCTAFLDSVSGHVKHITARMNLAFVAKSPIKRINDFAASRDWSELPLYSSASSSYNRDYKGEDEDGNQWPMINVFVRRDGKIHHWWGSELLFEKFEGGDFRHVDMLWPLWHFFDLTPEGRGDNHYPSLEY